MQALLLVHVGADGASEFERFGSGHAVRALYLDFLLVDEQTRLELIKEVRSSKLGIWCTPSPY